MQEKKDKKWKKGKLLNKLKDAIKKNKKENVN